jgi:hypothetical protein
MRFMNDWDIDQAERLYPDHPVLAPAVKTLRSLSDWVNANSDGWAYWPVPVRAAAKLMEMITRDGTHKYYGGDRPDVTEAEYKKALTPIKSFRTKHEADFVIYTQDGTA